MRYKTSNLIIIHIAHITHKLTNIIMHILTSTHMRTHTPSLLSSIDPNHGQTCIHSSLCKDIIIIWNCFTCSFVFVYSGMFKLSIWWPWELRLLTFFIKIIIISVLQLLVCIHVCRPMSVIRAERTIQTSRVITCNMDNKVVLCCIVLYCIVLYCTVLYCIVLYCIVLYCNIETCERRCSMHNTQQRLKHYMILIVSDKNM